MISKADFQVWNLYFEGRHNIIPLFIIMIVLVVVYIKEFEKLWYQMLIFKASMIPLFWSISQHNHLYLPLFWPPAIFKKLKSYNLECWKAWKYTFILKNAVTDFFLLKSTFIFMAYRINQGLVKFERLGFSILIFKHQQNRIKQCSR